MAPRLLLTLLGVGAMNSPRFAPAGLLLRYGITDRLRWRPRCRTAV